MIPEPEKLNSLERILVVIALTAIATALFMLFAFCPCSGS